MMTTATSSRTSSASRPPAPWLTANKMTATAPVAAASQNIRLGRSPARSTAATAVAAGIRAVTTATCADVLAWSAMPLSSGNPMTTNAATMARERHWMGVGRGARTATR